MQFSIGRAPHEEDNNAALEADAHRPKIERKSMPIGPRPLDGLFGRIPVALSTDRLNDGSAVWRARAGGQTATTSFAADSSVSAL